MMSNKNHLEYIGYFKDKISSLTTVDIKNQPNAISGEDLMNKLKHLKNIKYKNRLKKQLVQLI